MIQLLAMVLLVLLRTPPAVGQGMPDSSGSARISADRQVEKGALFSAISFANTELGARWAVLRPEAEKLFPALKMKAVPDLHVTIIYIGKGWAVEHLDLLRKAMAVHVTDTMHLIPDIVTLGRNNQVVAVELKGVPETFQAEVVSVKARLNAGGLKKPEAYDATFRAHVTLAESKDSPPGEESRRELKAFREWLPARLDLPSLEVVLEPSMPILLLLAGASRATPIPEYITVEQFLENTR